MKNRILFIENEPDLSDVLRIYLENHYYLGYSPSNSDALHRLENDDNVKLVIYNNEPPYCNGVKFLKIIRKNHFMVPYILLSDDEAQKDEIEIIKNSLFIRKPVEIETILQIIETIIPKSSPKERRKFPRVNVNKEITLKHKHSDKALNVHLENISLGGMKLKLKDFINNFEEKEIEIEFDDIHIKVNKFRTIYSDEESSDGISLGIEFKELNDESFKTIHKIIRDTIMGEIN